jgi:hypothetical protein
MEGNYHKSSLTKQVPSTFDTVTGLVEANPRPQCRAHAKRFGQRHLRFKLNGRWPTQRFVLSSRVRTIRTSQYAPCLPGKPHAACVLMNPCPCVEGIRASPLVSQSCKLHSTRCVARRLGVRCTACVVVLRQPSATLHAVRGALLLAILLDAERCVLQSAAFCQRLTFLSPRCA